MISPDSTDMLQLNDLISCSKKKLEKLGKPHYCSTAEDKETCDRALEEGEMAVGGGEGEVDDILAVTK